MPRVELGLCRNLPLPTSPDIRTHRTLGESLSVETIALAGCPIGSMRGSAGSSSMSRPCPSSTWAEVPSSQTENIREQTASCRSVPGGTATPVQRAALKRPAAISGFLHNSGFELFDNSSSQCQSRSTAPLVTLGQLVQSPPCHVAVGQNEWNPILG